MRAQISTIEITVSLLPGTNSYDFLFFFFFFLHCLEPITQIKRAPECEPLQAWALTFWFSSTMSILLPAENNT